MTNNLLTTWKVAPADSRVTFNVTTNSGRKSLSPDCATTLISGAGLILFVNQHEAAWNFCNVRKRGGTVKLVNRVRAT